MQIAEFQRMIEKTYLERDRKRGLGGTFMWFVEEVGELSTDLRSGADKKVVEKEFADVFAWLVSLASISGIEMEEAIKKYSNGCPACKKAPCVCSDKK